MQRDRDFRYMQRDSNLQLHATGQEFPLYATGQAFAAICSGIRISAICNGIVICSYMQQDRDLQLYAARQRFAAICSGFAVGFRFARGQILAGEDDAVSQERGLQWDIASNASNGQMTHCNCFTDMSASLTCIRYQPEGCPRVAAAIEMGLDIQNYSQQVQEQGF